ncbi:LysR family transcriptional regulator [Streptomyces flavofungini]|uniref:LysR family transcriptional regulator n=1 Tax=Streptomyces flavofungini TaxID=68200 RepID=A0ABS0XAK9_9ACTN|nr:LysR substrate-binding domain-containing protein [Streptomyces flavofungini]MBJ3810254.1 LysR family transcriptional regulator [Streptomyces flavofungini]GHC50460.1 LysR family transcriptional regulator [Streptomyces flavofungini]
MELRQLRYFLTVVEEANFTRAAAALHVAQPGVSAQIRQLERELGQRLLDRSGRSVTVTEVGAAVLPYARAALAAVDGMRQTADEFTGLLRGRVTIGLVSGAATHEYDVASVLADFHDAHPHVEMAVTEDTSDRMLAAVREGRLDLALAGLADEVPPGGVSWEVVVDEPLAALVAPDDPLVALAVPACDGADEGDEGDAGALAGVVPLAALADRPLISLPRGTGLRSVLERACTRAGFAPHVAFEAASPQLLVQLAARGLGVAVFPAPGARIAAARGLRVIGFEEPCPRGRIGLAWRTDGPAGPAARAFLTRLRAALPVRGSQPAGT